MSITDFFPLLLSFLYSSLMCIGISGNIWVLIVVSNQWIINDSQSTTTPHKSVYIYLTVLSIVDLLSLLIVPMLVTDILAYGWVFGSALCKVYFTCEGLNKALSPLFLTALTLDRYVAVCHPTYFWMRQSRIICILLLICILIAAPFIVSVAVNADQVFMGDRNGNKTIKCTLTFDYHRLYEFLDLAQIFCCYLLPLLIICSVYTAILLMIRKRNRTTVTAISLNRVVKYSVMVVVFYFICWTPYWCMRLMLTIDLWNDLNEENQSGHVFVLAGYLIHLLPYAQSAFNWLFYAFLNSQLRQVTTTSSRSRKFVDGSGHDVSLLRMNNHFRSYSRNFNHFNLPLQTLYKSLKSLLFGALSILQGRQVRLGTKFHPD